MISFPGGTEMFQFPPSARCRYFTCDTVLGFYSQGVSPFGNVRVNALLAAHRTLSGLIRPSSPVCSKASTSCPESLIKSQRKRCEVLQASFGSNPLLTKSLFPLWRPLYSSPIRRSLKFTSPLQVSPSLESSLHEEHYEHF